MRSRCPCLHQDPLLFRLPALEEGKDVVSRRITGLLSHLYLATAMAIRAWVVHGSKMNLSYLCPSLIVTSSSQLRRGLWECLAKSATSPEEHPEQASTEKAASEELDETCPDLAKQDVARTVLPYGFWKDRGKWKQDTRYAKRYLPDLSMGGRVRTDTGDTFVHFANERKPSPPQPQVEKALKSSKGKLVTLQIQNDLLYMQQNIQEVNFKTNLSHYICLAQLQFSF